MNSTDTYLLKKVLRHLAIKTGRNGRCRKKIRINYVHVKRTEGNTVTWIFITQIRLELVRSFSVPASKFADMIASVESDQETR